VLLPTDSLETTFDIVAIMREPAEDDAPALYELRIMHACRELKTRFEIGKTWKRCPWCSSKVPEKLHRIFIQPDAAKEV